MRNSRLPPTSARRADHRAKRSRTLAHGLIGVWLAVMIPLEFWGLPGRSADSTLFGGDPAWSADRYNADQALDERKRRTGGADTDLNPLLNRDQLVLLTASDNDRAEILRRFRLFSRQPDEMITFMALQRMRPGAGDLDPQLYQYGGGYIYSVGALVGLGSALGLTPVSGGTGQFLEQPERFGRIYLASRFLTLLFAVAALLLLVRIVEMLGRPPSAPLIVLLVGFSPVFVTCATEAKPHLPAATLALASMLALMQYDRRGRRAWAVLAGALAGLSFSFVLTGLAALLPLLAMMPFTRKARDQSGTRRLLYSSDLMIGVALGLIVFSLFNPYLLYNAVFDRAVLFSNVGNSTAMYAEQITRATSGALRTLSLLHEAGGWLLPLAGLIGFILLAAERPRATVAAATAGGAMLLLACFLAAGKPAEFARFLLVPTLALAIGAATFLSPFRALHPSAPWIGVLVMLLAMRTPAYLNSLWQDMRGNDARRIAAGWIEANTPRNEAIGVTQEPAPYATPPIDFAHRPIVLLPPRQPENFDPEILPRQLVLTADDEDAASGWWSPHYRLARTFPPSPWYSRVTWAHKPVFVFELRAGDVPPPPPQIPGPADAPPEAAPASNPSPAAG